MCRTNLLNLAKIMYQYYWLLSRVDTGLWEQLSSTVESEKVHILCVVPLMHQGLYKWDSCTLWSKAKNYQIVWRQGNPISWW